MGPSLITSVIPAQAGIHNRRPNGSIPTPARPNPRLRGDDEERQNARMTHRTASGSSGQAAPSRSSSPSSSRRTPGPMDTTHSGLARAIGASHPWVPASAGMTTKVDLSRTTDCHPRRRQFITADLTAHSTPSQSPPKRHSRAPRHSAGRTIGARISLMLPRQPRRIIPPARSLHG
jgi:hypothetical protein